jgi:hypothetical protein
MNKTATSLLKNWAVRKYFPFLTVESYSGRGPEGGRVSGGYRDCQAAKTLESLGYLKHMFTERSPISHGGYTTWTHMSRYEVTPLGQQLADTL